MKSKDKQPQTQVDCKTVACQKVGDLMQLLGGVHYGQFYLSQSLRGILGKLACIAAYSGSVTLSAKAFTTRKHAASTFARPRVRRPWKMRLQF